eukprot:scaffold12646_cov146-Skeletonema_dohrnii-CCMP3373.AAC.4
MHDFERSPFVPLPLPSKYPGVIITTALLCTVALGQQNDEKRCTSPSAECNTNLETSRLGLERFTEPRPPPNSRSRTRHIHVLRHRRAIDWAVVTKKVRNDHTTVTAPLPVCSAKFSSVGPDSAPPIVSLYNTLFAQTGWHGHGMVVKL